MVLKDNLEYWRRSLENPEGVIDEHYVIDEIIVDRRDIVEAIHKLRMLVALYCFFRHREWMNIIRGTLLKEIDSLIENSENIQYSEFIAFWKVYDFTYQLYKKLSSDERLKELDKLIEKYCEKRDELYRKLGYTDVTIQALYDSGASRKKGRTGVDKLADIVERISGKKGLKLPRVSTQAHLKMKCWYLIIDEDLFNSLMSFTGIKYEFGARHQRKMPDFVVRVGDHYLIIEAKHLKEPGGHQSAQVDELIDFIRYEENNPGIHYVSFLDGAYFNEFIKCKPPYGDKIGVQRKAIEETLHQRKKNFFVNTAGFIELINDLIEDAKQICYAKGHS